MEKRTPVQIEKHMAKIHTALASRGPLRAEEICTATKLPLALVQLPLRKLITKKSVKRHGRGKTRALQYAAR
jgi:hypothetical protein